MLGVWSQNFNPPCPRTATLGPSSPPPLPPGGGGRAERGLQQPAFATHHPALPGYPILTKRGLGMRLANALYSGTDMEATLGYVSFLLLWLVSTPSFVLRVSIEPIKHLSRRHTLCKSRCQISWLNPSESNPNPDPSPCHHYSRVAPLPPLSTQGRIPLLPSTRHEARAIGKHPRACSAAIPFDPSIDGIAQDEAKHHLFCVNPMAGSLCLGGRCGEPHPGA